jgi:GT2 family glycosyltransferase
MLNTRQQGGSIGAVVVTYKTPAEQLRRCLESLKQNNVNDVIVISNDKNNVGFAAAANAGAKKLTNELILFINPDAELIPSTIYKAIKLLRNKPRVGIVGLMLCDFDYKEEDNCYGSPVTPMSLYLRHIIPKINLSKSNEVGWVSGGAMIVRRSMFNALSGFDSQFFLYWEDVDLCRRAHQDGWAVCILPSVKVMHERGASLHDLKQKTVFYDQSADKFFHKHYSKSIWLFQRYSRRLYRLLSQSVD